MESNEVIEHLKYDYDVDHKLNFVNTISIETFDNIEKNIKKYSSPKIRNKQHLFLGINALTKDIIHDIESTGNNSEKNTNKGLDITVTDNILNNKKYQKEKELYTNNENINNNLNSQNIHIRKDIYGTEIKKGGKQRISFADNVQLLKAKIKFDYDNQNNNNNSNNEIDIKINKFHSDKRIRKINGLKQSILELKKLKDLKQIHKENSNIKKNKLVEIIEIENFKEENKNPFSYPSGDGEYIIDKETICCSASCNVY